MQNGHYVSMYIARPPGEAYEVASKGEKLPQWAAGLARSEIKREGDAWLMDAPFGKAKARFAERNGFGVMDHDVTLESGVTIHNPMRVVAHGEGTEVVFTLFRQPDMPDEQFAADKEAVEKDLQTLKALLEQND